MTELTRRGDFYTFWERAVNEGKRNPLNPKKEKITYPLNGIDVYKTEYNGYDKSPVAGFMVIPKNPGKRLPCVIHYHGYGGSKGAPYDYLPFTGLGAAVLAVDIRGQKGGTPDLSEYRSGFGYNILSLGVLDKEEYYLKKVYIDALKAIDFALGWEEIDPRKIILHGASQGGGLVTAAAALDKRPAFCFSDVPTYSDIEKRINEETGSFSGISNYLKEHPGDYEKVMETVSYFDTMNMAENIKCGVFASAALKDRVCPAECYYETYNRINAPKEISVYPLNGHEGGHKAHFLKKLEKLKELIENENI